MEDEKHRNNAKLDKRKPSVAGLLATGLHLLSKTCKHREGFSLTDDTLAAYEVALGDLEAEILECAMIRCARECEWFPSATEIRQRAETIVHPEEARKLMRQVQESRERFERGEDAPQLKSVTDEEVRLLAGEILSREDLLRLGFEKPRELSPIEKEARLAELQRQAESLKP